MNDETILTTDDDVDEVLADEKPEEKKQPIITLSLNENNTVKPTPLQDDGYETIIIGKKKNKNQYEDDMEVVTIKPKTSKPKEEDYFTDEEVSSLLDNIN